jgi:hypothetical protein
MQIGKRTSLPPSTITSRRSCRSLSENEQLFWESGHWVSIGRVRPQTARIVVGATATAAAAMSALGYDPTVR